MNVTVYEHIVQRRLDFVYIRIKMRHLLRFVQDPRIFPRSPTDPMIRLTDLVIVAVLTLLFALTAYIITQVLIVPEASEKLFQQQQTLGVGGFIVYLILLAPVLEETVYRLPLKYSASALTIAFGFLFYYLLSKSLGLSVFNTSFYPFSRLAFTGLFALLLWLLLTTPSVGQYVQNAWTGNLKSIVYFFTIVFAWSHIYMYHEDYFFLAPLLTLPQFILGLSCAYMRLNYGFWYGVTLHALYNSSLLWIPF
jgi:hypothetical protein